jgi:adenylate cyclase class 2
MPIEVEHKFPISDAADFQRRLAALDPTPGETESQSDQYFNHPSRDFATSDEALRIRRIGSQNFFTYKGPNLDRTSKTRREIELELAAGQQAAADAAAMLSELGFKPVAEVRKQRRHAIVDWQGQQVLVALDEVDGLGSFVELEIVTSDEHVEAARQCLLALAGQLGLANAERRSYLELLLASAAAKTPRP